MIKAIKRSLQWLLKKPVTWIADRFSSAPDKVKVHQGLSSLYHSICHQPGEKGMIFDFRPDQHPVIIFSDHHKGARDGSDDFGPAEKNYLAALEYYDKNNYHYLSLGDSEELWENNIFSVLKHNEATFEAEKVFVDRNAFYKVFGNHDLYWDNDPFAGLALKKMYGRSVKIHTGVILRARLPATTLDIFCTHGHQGDAQSDGNAFSKWFVTYVWGPLQGFLEINTNTPAASENMKTLHNDLMYQWSAVQNDLLLITGHTHQPVFNSLTHLERLYLQRELAMEKNDAELLARVENEIPRRKKEYGHVSSNYREMKPSYFNVGCCCFDDGTITGIEIAGGDIRLIKWYYQDGVPTRQVLEEDNLLSLSEHMENSPGI